jgi:hypothetical protein
MYPLITFSILILDKENLFLLLQELLKIKEEYKHYKDFLYVGIYLEGLKNIRQDIFPYLIEFCRIYKLNLIIFDVPLNLRVHFHLENIPIKLGCAYLELF